MEFLDKNIPQVQFDKINEFILAIISNKKAELVGVNGYGDTPANNKSAHTFYIVHYTYFLYKLQEYVESDVKELASGDPVLNEIYTSTVQNE